MNNHEAKSIKKIRKALGLTQAELARVLGYKTHQLISNIERGLCKLPMSAVLKIGNTHGEEFFKIITSAKLKDFAESFKKELGGIK